MINYTAMAIRCCAAPASPTPSPNAVARQSPTSPPLCVPSTIASALTAPSITAPARCSPTCLRCSLGDRVSGLAEGEYIAYLPAHTTGVHIIDDWDALGQRTTGSGTVTFDGVVVERDQLVARAGAVNAATGYDAFAQLLHAAIDTGIARGALEAAAGFVRANSRPWFEADVGRAIDDPLLIQRFGELGVTVTAAESTLSAPGAAVDTALSGGSSDAGEAGRQHWRPH
jgi:alkylation response protein AidB-like acyl-CoA dehydrogenase